MEAGVARVQDEVSKMVNVLEKSLLRKLQGDMHRCSANCCDNVTSGPQEVQRCIESCSRPIQEADSYMQNEFQNFQDRLQRCARDCQDILSDKISSASTDDKRAKLKKEMDACLLKCTDKSLQQIPDLEKRLKKHFGSLV